MSATMSCSTNTGRRERWGIYVGGWMGGLGGAVLCCFTYVLGSVFSVREIK
jgi:hypothetical protein